MNYCHQAFEQSQKSQRILFLFSIFPNSQSFHPHIKLLNDSHSLNLPDFPIQPLKLFPRESSSHQHQIAIINQNILIFVLVCRSAL